MNNNDATLTRATITLTPSKLKAVDEKAGPGMRSSFINKAIDLMLDGDDTLETHIEELRVRHQEAIAARMKAELDEKRRLNELNQAIKALEARHYHRELMAQETEQAIVKLAFYYKDNHLNVPKVLKEAKRMLRDEFPNADFTNGDELFIAAEARLKDKDNPLVMVDDDHDDHSLNRR